jgi:hypothetical protein
MNGHESDWNIPAVGVTAPDRLQLLKLRRQLSMQSIPSKLPFVQHNHLMNLKARTAEPAPTSHTDKKLLRIVATLEV